jgi:hypothetical protein
MKSLAIWYEPKKNQESAISPDLNLHFNHWKLRKAGWNLWDKNEYLLDIGLRINNGDSIAFVCIYLPQEIKEITEILEDLGSSLKDKRLLTAVFNEKYDPRPLDSKKYFEVKEGDNTLFYIYGLDIKSDVTSDVGFGGTIVKFPFNSISGHDTYYRLRLKTDFVKRFSYNYRPKSSYLESIFSSIELLDFRLNDTRNLNLSLLELISKSGQMFNISLIHLFVMRNLNDEYILSDLKLNNVRQLEEETWGNYLGHSEKKPKYKYDKVIAYHLKNKVVEGGNSIEDYSALLKFKFEDRVLNQYFIYLIVFGLGIGVFGNTLHDILKCFLNPYCNIIEHLKTIF